MATLTTSWVTYASASFDSGPATIKFFLEAKRGNSNITNNTTPVYTRLRSAYTEGSSMSGSGYKFTCTYASTVSGSGVWYFSNETITSGSKTVEHNSDGTKSITISASAYNKYWNFTKNLSATVTLPTIPRKAEIKTAPDFNDTDNPTITYINPAGNSVSSLQACISLTGSADDIAYRNINKTGTLSYTFPLTDAERDVLRNATTTANSRTVKFYVRTIIGGTTYYSPLTRNLTIINANPSYTNTMVETNQKVIDILGNNSASSLIQNMSNVSIAVTPITLKGATVKSVAVNHNGAIQTTTSTPYTFNVPVTSNSFQITVTDSRNNTNEPQTITKNLIPYQTIKPNSYIVERINPTSSDIRIKLDVVYYQQTFGTHQNEETVQYKVGENDWVPLTKDTDYTVDNTNHKITMDYTITNACPYDSDTNVIVKVNDLLTEWSEPRYVSKGIPVFEFGNDEVQVNGELYIADTGRNNKRGMSNLLIPVTTGASDLDDLYETGMYSYSPSTSNRPSDYGVVYTLGREQEANKFWVYQIALDAGGGIYRRQCINDLSLNSWTAWQPDLATDTGWVNLTPLVGSWAVLRCRRIGNAVTVEGHISSYSYSGSATNISTLPEQFRPVGKTEYIYGFAGGRRISRWYITVAGTLGVDWVADISNGALYTGATWHNFTITYMVN